MDIGIIIGLNTIALIIAIGMGLTGIRERLDRIAGALEKLNRESDED